MNKAQRAALLGGALAVLALWAFARGNRIPSPPEAAGHRGPRVRIEGRSAEPDLVDSPPVRSTQSASAPAAPRPEPVPAESLPVEEPAVAELSPSGTLWDYLQSVNPAGPVAPATRLETALRATARHLALDPTTMEGFVRAAQGAIADLEQGQRIRQVDLSTPIPDRTPLEVQVEISRRADERYDAVRQRALSRLEPFLGAFPGHEQFREEIETWAATVTALANGNDR